MPRHAPHITVSAVVSPSIVEEIERLAKANGVTRSTMIRQLLEEKLTERANQRQAGTYEKLEQRLAHIEKRFSGLMVKAIRVSAEDLYLGAYYYRYFTDMDKDQLKKMKGEAKAFAGEILKTTLSAAETGIEENE